MGLILRNTITGIGTDQAKKVNLSTATATATGATTVDEAIAILANAIIQGNNQTETVILSSLPADTWVNFPSASFVYNDWKIYHNNILIDDTFLIRDDNGTKQIKSSVPIDNLKFIFSN